MKLEVPSHDKRLYKKSEVIKATSIKEFLSLGLAELAKWVHSEGMYLSCPYLIFVRL